MLLLWFGLKGLLMFELYSTGMKTQQLEEEDEELFICHIHSYTEYNQQWNVCSAFNPSKSTHPGAVDTHTHTWSSGHTHHTWSSGHTHSPGAADTHTLMFKIIIHLFQKDFICILMKYYFNVYDYNSCISKGFYLHFNLKLF